MSEISNENQNKKARLGRGLGSLLGGSAPSFDENPATKSPQKQTAEQSKMSTQSPPSTSQMNTQTVPPESRIWSVSIDKIVANEYQPRNHFEKEKLEELAASIKQNGILQPITARKLPSGRFEIIAGERRWRAAQLAGLHQVPIILKTIENQASLELAIIENVQREDLNPIEEAEAYQRLANEFNLTQQQVADKVGKDRASVANLLRLLHLPEQLRGMVARAEITAGHGKVLLSLPTAAKQLEIAKKIVEEKMSVRQLEKIVQAELSFSTKVSKTEDASPNALKQKMVANLTEELQKALGTKVTIDYTNSKGKISVHFYSDDELNEIADRLKE